LLSGDGRRVPTLLCEKLCDIPDGLSETRLRLDERDPGVMWVELHQDLALFDELGFIGVDGNHGAAHLWGEAHEVAVHIGVVRLDFVVSEREVIDSEGGQAGQHTDEDNGWCPARLFGLPGGLAIFLLVHKPLLLRRHSSAHRRSWARLTAFARATHASHPCAIAPLRATCWCPMGAHLPRAAGRGRVAHSTSRRPRRETVLQRR